MRYILMLISLGTLLACAERETLPTTSPLSEPVREFEEAAPSPAAISAMEIYDDFFGAALASLEERIYAADVIVRATLASAEDGLLWFSAVEYLKGTGAKQFAVRASTVGRNVQWDDREAVLFLTLSTAQSQAGSSTASLEFADTTVSMGLTKGEQITYSGDLPEGYAIDSQNPVWLPAETTSSSSVANSSSDPSFITNDGSPVPIVSLSVLRAKIAWIEGGDGIEGYDQCIQGALSYDRHFRDWETYHGEPWPLAQSERQITSGVGGGGIIHDYEFSGDYDVNARYDRFWLSGTDAGLFSSQIVDDDTVASTGYHYTVTTARPLPRGTYRVIDQGQSWREVRCNFIPQHNRLEFVVTATAPAGTLHEAFFDPVTVGTAIAADTTNGVLKPAAFTDGNGASATLQRIAYESNTVKLKLSPHTGLANHVVDFIALDGKVSLSLDADEATVDAANNTMSWPVTHQPWEDGDKLMLRIHDGPVTPVP